MIPLSAIGETTKKTNCEDVISACKVAIEAKDTQIRASEEYMKKSKDYEKSLTDEIKAKDAKYHSILREPILLVSLGVLGTVTIGPIVSVVGVVIISELLK